MLLNSKADINTANMVPFTLCWYLQLIYRLSI
jgi:hypothetical protein